MENNKSITYRSIAVSIFAFLYTLTRQSFLATASKITLEGLDLNNISSLFGLFYSFLQIPYGILLDSLGINRMVFMLTGTMTIGLTTCALSTTALMFTIGRFITLLGCGGAFISTVKTIGTDYNTSTVKTWVGSLISGAILFAMLFIKVGAKQLESIENGWRYFYGIKAIILFIVWLYFAYLYKQDNQKTTIVDNMNQPLIKEKFNFSEIIYILKNDGKFQILILFSVIFFAIFYTINETTYMANFLYNTLNINKDNTFTIILGGFLMGFLTMDKWVKYIGQIKLCLMLISGVILTSLMMILYKHPLFAYLFLFMVGLSNGLQLIVIEMASRHVPKSMLGLLAGIMNVLFVGGAFPFQKLLSFIVVRIAMGANIIFYGTCVMAIISGFFMVKYWQSHNMEDFYQ